MDESNEEPEMFVGWRSRRCGNEPTERKPKNGGKSAEFDVGISQKSVGDMRDLAVTKLNHAPGKLFR